MSSPRKQVMIRPGTRVAAVPDEILAKVFGETAQDPRVEFAVLTFEYWRDSGATESLQLQQMLRVLDNCLTTENAYRFVALLAARGRAAAFFDLANPSVDRSLAMRLLLQSRGIDRDTIRYYAHWSGISPKSFADGFLLGVFESAASVVFDVYHLGELAWKVTQIEYRWLGQFTFDPRKAVTELWSQATVVIQALEGVLAQMDPRSIPAYIAGTWRKWNEEFAAHLEALDGEAAGRQLGLLAGTLWQLLTGLAAVARMLRLAGRAALRYGSLALGSVRGAAHEAALVIRDAAVVLATWTRQVFDTLPRVGLWFLHTLFPPRVIAQVVKEGRAFVGSLQGSLLPVFGETFALAYEGGVMRSPMAVAVVRNDRPVLMASLTEHLPSPGGGQAALTTSVDAALQDAAAIDRQVEKAFQGLGPAENAWDAAVIGAAQMEQAAQRLRGVLRNTLTQVTLEAFNELRRGGRFGSHTLGALIHRKMAARLTSELSAVVPGALIRTELTTATLVKTLASDSKVAARLARDSSAALSESVASLVMKDDHAMRLLGVPSSARTEAQVASALQNQFGWKSAKTTIGELRSDLIVADVKASIVRNVDFTSSTNLDQFESVWGRVADDLKGTFKGDPETVKKAYESLFSGGMPPEVQQGLDALRNHALRETVIRRLALQRVLGPGWFVSSEEMLYEGLAKLWASVK